MANLFRVVVPVTDIRAGTRFYAGVLGLPGVPVSPGRVYFDCEGTILALYDAIADGDAVVPLAGSEPMYLAVDDLMDVHRRVRDGGAVLTTDHIPGVGPLGSIVMRPWGERSFYATDPFGNRLCFVARETAFRG